jgi:hypothetical protein
MTQKKYSYYDWLNGKVVLIFSRREYNNKVVSEPILVSWDNFNEKEKAKIEKKQEILFNEMLKVRLDITTKDFITKYESSMFPKTFIEREYRSLLLLWNNKYICNGGICYSPIENENRTFDHSYYQEMIIHKTDCFINGIKAKYDAVPSPKSKYHDKNLVLPEVMITTVYQMLRFIKSIKSKRQNSSASSEQKNDSTIDTPTDQITEKSNQINPPLNGFDARFFSGADEYNLFLECKSALNARTSRTQKEENSEPSEVAKYSTIFNFLKEKSIIYPETQHLPFIKYLKEVHNANIPDRCKKFPYQPSINDVNTLKAVFKSWKSKH